MAATCERIQYLGSLKDKSGLVLTPELALANLQEALQQAIREFHQAQEFLSSV